MLIMSIITEVRSGFKHLQTRSGSRGCLTMSVASGVIVGGGRIGSFLHETNGTADLLLELSNTKLNHWEDLRPTNAFSDQNLIGSCEKARQMYYYPAEKLRFQRPRNPDPSTSALEMMI